MSRGEIIKRSWSKNSQIFEHTDILDIWDSGSHIYERWPNGDEIYWKVISRELTDTGFTEFLEKMPQWKMPGEVLRRERVPLLEVSPSQYLFGSWSVEQSFKPLDVMQETSGIQEKRLAHSLKPRMQNMPQVHSRLQVHSRPQVQGRPQVHNTRIHQAHSGVKIHMQQVRNRVSLQQVQVKPRVQPLALKFESQTS